MSSMAAEPTPVPVVVCRVCRAIRSKGAGVVYGSRVQFENGFYSSAVFWCLATAEPVGPDDGAVHPHACIAGRVCFAE
jgi:hypothetical protein